MSQDLDVEIAEQVMGWQRKPDYNYWMSFPSGDSFKLHELVVTWKPSSSIAAAFQVLEYLYDQDWSVEIHRSVVVNDDWMVTLDHLDRQEVMFFSKSLPSAICRAALKTIENANDHVAANPAVAIDGQAS